MRNAECQKTFQVRSLYIKKKKVEGDNFGEEGDTSLLMAGGGK